LPERAAREAIAAAAQLVVADASPPEVGHFAEWLDARKLADRPLQERRSTAT